jgi:hypothetical protein
MVAHSGQGGAVGHATCKRGKATLLKSESDQHDCGEHPERQADHELVNAMAGKGDARPEDERDYRDKRVADRGTEQAQGRCRKGGE